MKRLGVLSLVLLAACCASVSPRVQLVTAHQGIQTILATADDSERVLCFGSTALPAVATECSTAAAAQVGLTGERHRAIRRAFVKAYDAQIALGAVITAWVRGQPVDMSTLISAASEIDVQLAQMNVKAPNLGKLIKDLLNWKAEIERIRELFGGGL